MRGPIDYIIVEFQDKTFSGRILEELDKAVQSGVISVLEVAVVARGEDGTVTSVEPTDPALTGLLQKLNTEKGLVDADDVAEVGELLEDGAAAGLLVIEQLWAKGLKQAIRDEGGVLVSDGRIHPDASKALDEGGNA